MGQIANQLAIEMIKRIKDKVKHERKKKELLQQRKKKQSRKN